MVDKASGETREESVTLKQDEGNRADTNAAGLAALKPVAGEKGVITAGNASQLSDGASACVVMDAKLAEQRGLQPLGIFRGFTVAACEPDEMGIGPVFAVPRLLERTGLRMDQIDLWELNEAFAVQVVYCRDRLGIPMEKLNVDGGAISIGHPVRHERRADGGARAHRRQAAGGALCRVHHVHRRGHGRGRPLRNRVAFRLVAGQGPGAGVRSPGITRRTHVLRRLWLGSIRPGEARLELAGTDSRRPHPSPRPLPSVGGVSCDFDDGLYASLPKNTQASNTLCRRHALSDALLMIC